MENSKFNVSDASALFFFFFDFLGAQNMVWVIEGKIKEMIWGDTKINSS